MRSKIYKPLLFLVFLFIAFGFNAQELYNPPHGQTNKWYSFENINAEKGQGGKENKGAKGHPADRIVAGETVTLLETNESGVINRIWITINDRSPEMLRSLHLEMFWDGSDKPAVSAPLGDFFGIGLGRKVRFENALFSDPEGRSFNCFIPMPFKNGAKVTITNESDKDLGAIFFDINMLAKEHPDDILYFHTYWNREVNSQLGKDFRILPTVQGKGRFLGTNIGIFTNEDYKDSWWGEGEVKIYLDGDSDYPSLVGTGTEDYIGTAWGQGTFDHQFQGCLIANNEKFEQAFYRYHIPDPIYFKNDIKVTIQQMGGWPSARVKELVSEGASLIPVTVSNDKGLQKLLEMQNPPTINDDNFPKGWTNFYRSDDVSATAYFY
ncbi:MAG: glycoside hydrolase family 172 protein, partial [Flavobacteriaceae bacterium]|nr:glycoside hydrolase family 172 protein [Flavobacteriaceae bacterium]